MPYKHQSFESFVFGISDVSFFLIIISSLVLLISHSLSYDSSSFIWVFDEFFFSLNPVLLPCYYLLWYLFVLFLVSLTLFGSCGTIIQSFVVVVGFFLFYS